MDANLTRANLTGSNLTGADLSDANLTKAWLREANLDKAWLAGTFLVKVDLTGVVGLKTILHVGPSHIGLETLRLCAGRLPDEFFRGAGLSDWEIKSAKLYDPDLTNEKISRDSV